MKTFLGLLAIAGEVRHPDHGNALYVFALPEKK